MKYSFLVFCVCTIVTGLAFCDGDTGNNNNNSNLTGGKMKIKIGQTTFTATLSDNPTAAALKSLLPMTLNMVELNGNEKYVDLSHDLPTNASNPGTIKTGDLML